MDDQTIEMSTFMLGILKSGAAYLPIDRQNPIDRSLEILNDSKTKIILTRSQVIKDISFTRLQNIKNINKHILLTQKRQQITDLDMLPMPDRSLVDYNKYNQHIGEGCVMKGI